MGTTTPNTKEESSCQTQLEGKQGPRAEIPSEISAPASLSRDRQAAAIFGN